MPGMKTQVQRPLRRTQLLVSLLAAVIAAFGVASVSVAQSSGAKATVAAAKKKTKKPKQGKPGRPGVPGPQGPAGAKGDKGDSGPAGAKGDKGDSGPAGPKGDRGEKGDPGTASAKGDKGDKGEKGDKGDPGAAGQKGADGKNGTNGTNGTDGANGVSAAFFQRKTVVPVALANSEMEVSHMSVPAGAYLVHAEVVAQSAALKIDTVKCRFVGYEGESQAAIGLHAGASMTATIPVSAALVNPGTVSLRCSHSTYDSGAMLLGVRMWAIQAQSLSSTTQL
jgi:hypothetical protein